MRPAIRALLWQQWRETWWIIVPALGVLSLRALAYRGSDILAELHGSTLTPMSVIYVLILLPVSHCQRQTLQPGLPQRTLVLPEKTVPIGLTILLYRTVVVAAVSVLAGFLYALPDFWEIHSGASPPEVDWELVWWTSLVCVAGYSYIQGILWLVGNRHARIGVTVLLASPAALLGFLWLLDQVELGDVEFTHLAARYLVYTLAVAWTFVWLGIALVGVHLQRRGAELRLPFPARLLDRLAFSRKRRFRSPAHAQRWFEWRRIGMLLPCAAAVILILLVVGTSITTRGQALNAVLSDLPIYLSVVSYPAAGVAGLWAASKNHSERASGLATFTFVRPMRTSGLVLARFKAAATSIVLILAILLALQAPVYLQDLFSGRDLPPWPAQAVDKEPFWSEAPILLAYVACLWTLVVFSPALIGYGLLVILIASFVPIRGYGEIDISTYVIPWMLVICVAATVADSLCRAAQRRFLTKAYLFGAVGVSALVIWHARHQFLIGFYDPAFHLPTFALVFLLAPIFAAPVILDWQRHR